MPGDHSYHAVEVARFPSGLRDDAGRHITNVQSLRPCPITEDLQPERCGYAWPLRALAQVPYGYGQLDPTIITKQFRVRKARVHFIFVVVGHVQAMVRFFGEHD
jgi:hypothetical protein